MRNLFILRGSPSCVDKDTEYFNGIQWKPISNYTEGEKVLQYSPDGDAELVTPIKYIKAPCFEGFYHIVNNNGTVNQVLTGNHDIAYITSKGNLNKKSVRELLNAHHQAKYGFKGKFINHFKFKGSHHIEEYALRLWIAISADGSLIKDKMWRIRVLKEYKINRMRELLILNKIPIDERVYEDGSHNFYIPVEYGTKEFPVEFYDLDPESVAVFRDEIVRWDGNRKNIYRTTIKRNADIAQFILSQFGRRVAIHIDCREGQTYEERYLRKSTCFEVVLTTQKYTGIDKKNSGYNLNIEKKASEDGFQYCFTVPSGYIVLRRKNVIFITGNCGKSTWVKENELEPYTLSADSIRLMYQSPVTNTDGTRYISQNNDNEVWALLMKLLETRMSKGEFVVIDATHYKSSLISRYKDLVHKYRYRVNVVDFSDVPEEECIRRNAARDAYKRVPEETIRKMYACLHDDTEVKKSYKMITPQEASEIVNTGLKPVVIDDSVEKVVVFGDIHGCYAPIQRYFEENPFNDKYCYIFCGDYLDRGIQNKQVLEFLLGIYKKPNVFLIEGNHDQWVRMYASKDYVEPEKKENEYNDFYLDSVINQLKFKQSQVDKKIRRNTQTMNELSNLLKEAREENPDCKEVIYEFETINVPEKQKQLGMENSKLEKESEDLSKFANILLHEKHNSKDTLLTTSTWYEEEFGEGLSLNIKNLLKKKLNMEEVTFDNPIKSKEFLNNTVPQIKDLDKAELRQLCDRFIQMSYFAFNGSYFVVTHAGLPCVPDIFTPTQEMIKGVGKYEDHELIDAEFEKNTPSNFYQIHGHRNSFKVPIKNGRTFNLEGEVEFGGHLRILEIYKKDEGVAFRCIEIQNDIYKQEEPKKEFSEQPDLEILKDMIHSKLIQVKNLEDNIISLNFTREAFYDRKWNDLTCHARGLFVDKTNGTVVARSFTKFHNFKEVPETETAGLKENFVFPVVGYKKENGFLGIISKYRGKIHFFTKSTNEGPYVNWFIGALCENYNIEALIPKGLLTDGGQYETLRYTDTYNRLVKAKNEIPSYKNNRRFEQPNDLDWDYIKNFEEQVTWYDGICTGLKEKLAERLEPSITEGYSYVFECIDPANDPHIIKYEKPVVFLLEVFKNQLKEEHCSWEDLISISDGLHVPLKQRELEFKTWEEFVEWKDKFTKDITQWDCKYEGYVLEDAQGFRVKFKSSFYRFWKQMRAVKDSIAGGRGNKKIYKTKEEIQVVKLLESIPREQLKQMSIIDVEDKFYESYGD